MKRIESQVRTAVRGHLKPKRFEVYLERTIPREWNMSDIQETFNAHKEAAQRFVNAFTAEGGEYVRRGAQYPPKVTTRTGRVVIGMNWSIFGGLREAEVREIFTEAVRRAGLDLDGFVGE